MKSLLYYLLTCCLISLTSDLNGASGVFEYYLNTQNDAGTLFHGNYGGGTSFEGSNLGTLSNLGESQIISVTGIKTFQNSGDDILSARINYRVWKSDETPGPFIIQNLPQFGSTQMNGDKEWQTTNIDLSSNITEQGTYFVEVYFDATGDNNGFQFTIFESNNGNNFTASFVVEETVLPVRLESFSAETHLNNINVFWTTLTETNNEKFNLYKSSDGENWNHLKNVTSQYGRSKSKNSRYQVIDDNPYYGINFYRLTQTDYDGTTTELGIASIHFKQVDVTIYPNPFIDRINIKLPQSQLYHTHIIDMAGKVINNHSFRGDFYQLDLQDLTPGQYHLNILNQGKNIIHSSIISKLR
ncbi:MAG: T9SS type A sorting domain-containing protein [Saprospiraceae bacterium]|nr:T9SS type A sorting domain-containing protein [Saprospiraceae bacterium]